MQAVLEDWTWLLYTLAATAIVAAAGGFYMLRRRVPAVATSRAGVATRLETAPAEKPESNEGFVF